MGKFLRIFIGIVLLWSDSASAIDLFGNLQLAGNYLFGEDITVHNGAVFEAHDISPIDSVNIYNNGTIYGNINVCANCIVQLENFGTFNAMVVRETGAQFVQVITSIDSATDIGVNVDKLLVRGVDGLSLDSIINLAHNADYVEIVDSNLDAGTSGVFVAPVDTELHGDVFLVFDDIPNEPLELFSDVVGDGVVYADSPALDALHAFYTYRVDNDIFMRMVRSTDYARILNNNMGRFLNNLRASGGDDKLFSRLDTAQSLHEINDVLAESVRTKPINLMNPIRNVYLHKSLEIMHIDDFTNGAVEPFAIYSSNFLASGIGAGVSFNFDDLHLNLYGNILNVDYKDDVNKYSAVSFGIGVNAHYDINKNYFAGIGIGINKTYFDVGSVFDGAAAVNNPDGVSGFAFVEFGHRFDFGNDYSVAPFAMVGGEYMSVANADNTNMSFGGGAEFGYKYEFDGLRYDYGVRTMARSDSVFGAGINISVWSIFDAAGANVHIDGIYDSDFGMSYKLSLNGIFRF